MRICVYGLWHLGSVTAACVAEHFETAAYDPDTSTRENMRQAKPPVAEPGLAELLRAGLDSGRLTIADDLATAVAGADVVWVTFDTPVTEEDVADTELVEGHVRELFPHLADGATVLLSSQLPVGTARRLERGFALAQPGRRAGFACSPENLRLGSALQVFREPDRIVAGVRTPSDRDALSPLFAPFCERMIWMSVESAEMTKHALNAFLAVSVAYINEIASICETVGADAHEVSAGLKSDVRIGPKAYLRAGAPFAGGTLARDVVFLRELAAAGGRAGLISSAFDSNAEHKQWARRVLQRELADLAGKKVAVLGLTYKAGTDTLRRSEALALCRWLVEQAVEVRAYDPAISALPPDADAVRLATSAVGALDGADALVIATEWPAFRSLGADDVARSMPTPLVLDPNRFLGETLGDDPRIRYVAVGKAKGGA